MRQRMRRFSVVRWLVCWTILDVSVHAFLEWQETHRPRSVGRRPAPCFRIQVRRNPTDSHDPSLYGPNTAPGGSSGGGGGNTNDPRVFRKLQRQEHQALVRVQERQRALRREAEKRKQAAEALKLPPQPLVETIGGGTAKIFEMARHMRFWEPSSSSKTSLASGGGPPPRWHPTLGISDVNPNFRTSAPVMSNQGYAGTIWRNARKDRPSQWRYALRTYDRMAESERNATTTVASAPSVTQPQAAGPVRRSNVHHEGALLACAKLGMWHRAIEIYHCVEEEQRNSVAASSASNATASTVVTVRPMSRASISALTAARQKISLATRRKPSRIVKSRVDSTEFDGGSGEVYVTEAMLLSVIRACVRASRQLRKQSASAAGDAASAAQRAELTGRNRAPLDAAVTILKRLVSSPSSVDFPVVARHVNPIAAAYQSLGLNAEAHRVISRLLANRTSGPEGEDGTDPFNVHDVKAKDKASYSLLVQGAVTEGDFAAAVDALRVMTESGLYPNQRHLNAWTEISERKTKHRTTRSWTKKREEFWLESVR